MKNSFFRIALMMIGTNIEIESSTMPRLVDQVTHMSVV